MGSFLPLTTTCTMYTKSLFWWLEVSYAAFRFGARSTKVKVGCLDQIIRFKGQHSDSVLAILSHPIQKAYSLTKYLYLCEAATYV
jgi:hypothetical protein